MKKFFEPTGIFHDEIDQIPWFITALCVVIYGIEDHQVLRIPQLQTNPSLQVQPSFHPW